MMPDYSKIRTSLTKHRVILSAFGLGSLGLFLIVSANLFSLRAAKVQLDSLVAETGALLLVVGTLTWLFDYTLRAQLLDDVSAAVSGSSALRDCGLTNCIMDGHEAFDKTHWKNADELIIGRLHSAHFLKRHNEVLSERTRKGKTTTILVLNIESPASDFLASLGIDKQRQQQGLSEIERLVHELDNPENPKITVLYHNQVLRYSFVYTGERIWVKFYANSPRTVSIPALEVRADTPLFEFFQNDISALRNLSHESR